MTLQETLNNLEQLLKDAGSEDKLKVTPENILLHIEETPGYLWNLYEGLAFVKSVIRKFEALQEQEESAVWVKNAGKKLNGKTPTASDLKMLAAASSLVQQRKKHIRDLTQMKERLDGLIRAHEKKISMIPGLQGWANRLG